MREQLIRMGGTCLFLWSAAVPDIRTKRIPLRGIVLFTAAVAAGNLVMPTDLAGCPLWVGVIPGAVMLLLSLIFKGELGEGDGICVMACGFCTGLDEIIPILEGALLLCAAFGGYRILSRKICSEQSEDKLAFIPFLAISSSIRLIVLLCSAVCGAFSA